MKTRFSFLSFTLLAFFLFSFGLCDKAVDSVVVTFDSKNILFPAVSFTLGGAVKDKQTTLSGSYTVAEINTKLQDLTKKTGITKTFSDILTCNLTSLDLTITNGATDFSVIKQAKCVAHFTGGTDLVLLDNSNPNYGKFNSISIPIPTGEITNRILALQSSSDTNAGVSYELTVTTNADVTTPVNVTAVLSGSVEVK